MTKNLQQVNMDDANFDLAGLIEAIHTQKSPMIIAKSGVPQVKVVPISYEQEQSSPKENQPLRKMGTLKGKVTVPDDFDTLYADEIEAMFSGSLDVNTFSKETT